VHEIVRFARDRGILCQGRGSAANSAVCYVLGIAAVDPAKHDLLFERFVSANQASASDLAASAATGDRSESLRCAAVEARSAGKSRMSAMIGILR
jgi:DNA polymerase III alpha subunit